MNWEEIVERHAKDYKDYLNGYKQSQEQLKADKDMLLQHMKCKEETLPDNLKDKLARDKDASQQEWGMYGNKFKNMRVAHQREVDKYFRSQQLSQEISTAQEKKPERGAGRN
ncbi:hypothetical protein [Chitinophaga pinensis]|uniref:Uncharacterized protein n=1 Tax=Chitinophaga pinensis (strain ATCC 43595 / DSM 2588 / LMG 13176 / NBRC 15968 / NCIMB 11800 / UQM 2034) TaxID=485918 RepID=A0A979GAH9_CHIPD|nr:hypothetical protein [Chitinophaga pinensis]ACU63728.1 hypothetical protein Cpin_6323 [Chitinophaga pinensis DSM 2588]